MQESLVALVASGVVFMLMFWLDTQYENLRRTNFASPLTYQRRKRKLDRVAYVATALIIVLGVVLWARASRADDLGVHGVGSCAPMPEMRKHLEGQGVTADFFFLSRDWFKPADSESFTMWSSSDRTVLVITATDLLNGGDHTCIIARGSDFVPVPVKSIPRPERKEL